MHKANEEEVVLASCSNDYTEIVFGEKPTLDTFYEGCWHPTYRYKKLLYNAPYFPVLRLVHPNDIIKDVEIIFRPNIRKYKENKKCLETKTLS